MHIPALYNVSSGRPKEAWITRGQGWIVPVFWWRWAAYRVAPGSARRRVACGCRTRSSCSSTAGKLLLGTSAISLCSARLVSVLFYWLGWVGVRLCTFNWPIYLVARLWLGGWFLRLAALILLGWGALLGCRCVSCVVPTAEKHSATDIGIATLGLKLMFSGKASARGISNATLLLGWSRFTYFCWVGKHINIVMKPTNSPTNPKPTEPKKK